ncbi:aldo/keto reductase [Mucilaginibacter terrae]|uniref:D-threo-aldose 1-dehydrogenase n=1 Tax=Mucilaginibacter terrae TaxID=1955052 RepID=A0ABU3GN33_9SPHI|nr:aldo/keto reductase [Mucilaginibacter terrae]MDT3401183.1 D-threo-aldose 1-dehydrogenase [Mucilaginibacter terrae]
MQSLPKIIFGTSSLGNLYKTLEHQEKTAIIKSIFKYSNGPVVLDSAGKYGAGLALESIGDALRELNIKPGQVTISNKLGWLRTKLSTPEPTFEPGVWKGLKYDAIQKISYLGILECFEQGLDLLGGYMTQMVSVHDPDEYLASATSTEEQAERYQDIKDAYRALFDLKAAGKVKSVGIGAKDWKCVRNITRDIKLDWVMIANSMTLHSHPKELIQFMEVLKREQIPVINSAIFNGGFLLGGDFYNYKFVKPEDDQGKELLSWRERFFNICKLYGIQPVAACMRFALSVPGTHAIALGTSSPDKVRLNLEYIDQNIPESFWNDLALNQLISSKLLI